MHHLFLNCFDLSKYIYYYYYYGDFNLQPTTNPIYPILERCQV